MKIAIIPSTSCGYAMAPQPAGFFLALNMDKNRIARMTISEDAIIMLFSIPVLSLTQSEKSTGKNATPMIRSTFMAFGLFSSFSSEVVLGKFAYAKMIAAMMNNPARKK